MSGPKVGTAIDNFMLLIKLGQPNSIGRFESLIFASTLGMRRSEAGSFDF